MHHSIKLKETRLWKVYSDKIEKEDDKSTERQLWVENVYKNSINELKHVVRTFPNYTLHDEIHVLNVLDAIAGILGSDVDKLSSGECELLIAVSAMHDLGMVYKTDDDEKAAFQNKRLVNSFLQKYHPELMGTDISKCDEDDKDTKNIQKDFLRYAHPFRVDDVISGNPAWDEVFKPPLPVCLSKTDIIAVCEAHGQEPDEFVELLDSLKSDGNNVDYLFCAFLLRLADLLDFDDSRAPSVLINYAKDNNTSIEEWRKHKFSRGFSYPPTPSEEDLPYSATSTDPNLEHLINSFLNWIDDELLNCLRYRKLFSKEWLNFCFPSKIKRGIKPVGYLSGEFSLTMDHDKVLELLSGSDLYEKKTVFIRELLQNSIDAIRLRSTVDSTFAIENGRIDLWDWYDENGDRWFRIDDNGTGMTLGIIKRYFLKVGNSYYNSTELLRNIYKHTKNADLEYQGISQFGIGFLSCFLCGNNIEVSTLYFNDDISEQETGKKSYNGYGIRLSIPQLKGYYIVRCQSEKNHCSPMKSHHFDKLGEEEYRQNPGTSILLRLNEEELNNINIKEFVNKLILGTDFPVYFNNERVGLTKNEFIDLMKEYQGVHEYELSPVEKEKFCNAFPMLKDKYPRIFSSTYMFSEEKNPCWKNCIGIVVRFFIDASELNWKYKDALFKVHDGRFDYNREHCQWIINLEVSENGRRWFRGGRDDIREKYGNDAVNALFDCFDGLESCPSNFHSLGKEWEPFEGQETLAIMWDCYIHDKSVEPGFISLDISDNRLIKLLNLYSANKSLSVNFCCYYNGIQMGDSNGYIFNKESSCDSAFIILEGDRRPTVNLSRSNIKYMPFEIMFGMNILSLKTAFPSTDANLFQLIPLDYSYELSQGKWLSILNSEYGLWGISELSENKTNLDLLQLLGKYDYYSLKVYEPLAFCAVSYICSKYEFYFDYPELKLSALSRKTPYEFTDLPPYIFFHPSNDDTQKYIRIDLEESSFARPCIINLDHDVIKWIIKNRYILEEHFSRYYRSIILALDGHQSFFIDSINSFYHYITNLPESQRHGIDLSNLRELSNSDFPKKNVSISIIEEGTGKELKI